MGHVSPQYEHDAAGHEPDPVRGSKLRRIGFLSLCLFAVAVFTSLGIWQLERRVWKLDLIAQVNQRIHAPAVLAPGPDKWPEINARDDAYRHVYVTGHFLNDKETLVQAVTEHGPGFWVMTPLRENDGTIVFINRGFVPPDHRDHLTRKTGQINGKVSMTGLLRITEPKGGFLRTNRPQTGYWYSRDVVEIAKSLDLKPVASYFIDADSTPNPGGLPIGGMTVVAFHNNHLIYAITWFSLALIIIIRLLKPRIFK